MYDMFFQTALSNLQHVLGLSIKPFLSESLESHLVSFILHVMFNSISCVILYGVRDSTRSKKNTSREKRNISSLTFGEKVQVHVVVSYL